MVPTPGIEPGSTVLQTAAMTTFAKLAKLVLKGGIEPPIQSYQDCVMPFNYKSLGCLMRIELMLSVPQTPVQTTTL